jgi:hypothetical protein
MLAVYRLDGVWQAVTYPLSMGNTPTDALFQSLINDSSRQAAPIPTGMQDLSFGGALRRSAQRWTPYPGGLPA